MTLHLCVLNVSVLRAGAMLGCADLAARGDGCTEEVGVPFTTRLWVLQITEGSYV